MIPQCKNSSLRSISREVDLAWLAGIIDGEANIQAALKKANNGKNYFCPKVRISSTDIRMIQKIADIYRDLRVVFFYTINKRKKYNDRWKDQLHIEVASQGSSLKVLQQTLPYLQNKAGQAAAVISMIKFVQGLPKGGNTRSYDYLSSDPFIRFMNEYKSELKWYIDPSTTTRRAGESLSW